MKGSNATPGCDFSRVRCDTEVYEEEDFLFGDVFQYGLQVLTEYLYKKTLPEDKPYNLLLGKLLEFVEEERSIKIDPQKLSETELTMLLANHLFGKLATSCCYVVDKSYAKEREDQCFCEDKSCKMTGQYGDTSVGNVEVWHGNLDIFIKNELIVEPVEDKPDSPGGKAEEKVKSSVLSGNPQIIAQTIVFSFLQKHTHPEREHFLTPCIGVGNTTMFVMFYDSEHDVILESSHIPLFQKTGPSKYEFDDAAILVSWFAVNYKFLSSGLTEAMRKYKGLFFTEAKDKLNVYEEKLRLGNVIRSLPTQILKKKSLQFSSFLEEQENKLIEIIHREKREQKVIDKEGVDDQSEAGPSSTN
ncbi:uncharacterized protein LOC134243263 [Saccostrea cucullata]|uniref:uncharacterized protein LOC134243263 n=1 Tax=Saccostrea cuccullata TaxID=36930 RepID=UPI002ED3D93B